MRRLASRANGLGIGAYVFAVLALAFAGVKGLYESERDSARARDEKDKAPAIAFAREAASDSALAAWPGTGSLDVRKVRGAFLGVADYLEKPVEVEFNGKRYLVGMCTDADPYGGNFTVVKGNKVFVGIGGTRIRAGTDGFGAVEIAAGKRMYGLVQGNFSANEIAAVKKLFAEVAIIAEESMGKTGREIALLKGERHANELEQQRLPKVRDSIAEVRRMVGKRQTGMEVTNYNGHETSRTIFYDSIISPKYDSLRAFYHRKMDSVDGRIGKNEERNGEIDREIKRKGNSLKFGEFGRLAARGDSKVYPARKQPAVDTVKKARAMEQRKMQR